MAEKSITCPKCGQKIQLSKTFTHQIEERIREEFESEAEKRDKEFQEKLNKERAKLKEQAKKQAEELLSTELKDLKAQLKEESSLRKEAQNQELNLRKRIREVEERERGLKLELERALDKERKKIWEEATAKLAEEHHLRNLEKDKQLNDMREQIKELKRKAEQGSQQTQGEVLELELEDVLRSNFRFDDIEPVAKGVRGADVLQKICTSSGHHCGTILWESKHTKSWSNKWIQKLKDDQREAKADVPAIVSAILPKDVSRIGCIKGVWVTDFPSLVGLATALRTNLIEIDQARSALIGKSDKMELIYNYLSGSEFRQRVEAIIESFVAMRSDLDSERRAMERVWAKREKQIQRVIESTAGMYGDLQGIIGASLPQLKILELPSGGSQEP